MLGKKICLKKLAKKVKVIGAGSGPNPSHYESLLKEAGEEVSDGGYTSSPASTPTGFLALYIGEERERFLIPTGFLAHPLFRMLLEKARDEFGFEQAKGLVVPCTVSTFQEVVTAVESCGGKFDFGNLVEEFV